MLASAQVIGHRTVRLAAAGPHPNARDRREFAMMWKEKVEAGAQAARAVAAHSLATGQSAGSQGYKNMLRSSAAFLALTDSRTPRQLIARQAALARALEQSGVSIAGVSSEAAHLTRRGLKPIHAKAVANARRLTRL
jgi:hypothetical protein